jgi:hypothetical protein
VGYRYDIIRIYESKQDDHDEQDGQDEQDEDDPQLKQLKDIDAITIGRSRVKLVKMTIWRTLPDFINGYLAEAITSGEVWTIGRCNYSACRKFFVAERTGRKTFYRERCRNRFHNQREERKRQNKIRQRKRRKLQQTTTEERQIQGLIIAGFAEFLNDLRSNPQSPTAASRKILSKLSRASPQVS